MSDTAEQPPSPKRAKVVEDTTTPASAEVPETSAEVVLDPAITQQTPAESVAETAAISSEPAPKTDPTTVEEEPSSAPTAATSSTSPPQENAEETCSTEAAAEPLSKRALKKLAKIASWQQTKLIKRAAEREKYKQRRADAVARGLPPTGPSRKALKHNTRAASANKQRICVDMDFDGLMSEKDVCKVAKQLLWVYTINRKASAPAQISYTAVREGSRVQQALQRNDGYRNWDVEIAAESYDQHFETKQIVYLTSDSDQVLERLSVDDVYVIGGLVDHNHHKGLTLARAEERGWRTARLPLSEHVEMKTRTVLTIVHVFDILLRVSMGEQWKDAIMGVLPSRKGAKARPEDGSEADEKDEPVEETNGDEKIEPIADEVLETNIVPTVQATEQ